VAKSFVKNLKHEKQERGVGNRAGVLLVELGSARPAKCEAGLAVGCYSCNSFRAGMDGRRMERRSRKWYEDEDKIMDAQENGKGTEPKDRL
jgi:hypothetical protein